MTSDESFLKESLNLPATAFPMRGNLPEREGVLLERWERTQLWQRLRRESKGKPRFILHDGPPYANGHLHIGHALNKILKDIINRARQMSGYDANYVPGWDCHGLPIEWKVEENYRRSGRNKNDIPINDFRQECREFAQHWIAIQRTEFQRMGIMGDWQNPYTTMSFDAEATIVQEIGKFLMAGTLYRRSRPVLWSVVERTALAEAEVEYQDHTSPAITVGFPITHAPDSRLPGAHVLIWTTTPWTLPANCAIAFSPEVEYALCTLNTVAKGTALAQGDKVIVARSGAAALLEKAGVQAFSTQPVRLEQVIAAHPLKDDGYTHRVPLVPAEFVEDTGSGLVHIAPGHGQDDYKLGLKHDLEVPETVGEDGAYLPHVPLFAGLRVLDDEGCEGPANSAVLEALRRRRALIIHETIRHSYPFSWRSKTPLIIRNTLQWFISMSHDNLRTKALKAIEGIQFFPEAGRTRLASMIAERPDWCVSRQRAWGVPLPVFVHKASGEPLRDSQVLQRIVQAFQQDGADTWFSSPPARFLEPDHDPDAYTRVDDVVDVWFDSGSTHSFVLEAREDLAWPASLYLEGSDQHRGWFHSSLLVGCGTRGQAPYRAVLTHGFTLAEDGRKMSKSVGNIVEPATINETLGAEILRLWVAGSEYTSDLTIGQKTLQRHVESYRRIRNSLRWMLGNLDDRSSQEAPTCPSPLPECPLPERMIRQRLVELNHDIRNCSERYDFQRLFRLVLEFCTQDLSATFFDIRKDRLYCDHRDAPLRRLTQQVLAEIFDHVCLWLAPVLCFTTEEAWLHRYGEKEHISVHAQQWPAPDAIQPDPEALSLWEGVTAIRRAVLGALELERTDGRLKANLQAHPTVYLENIDLCAGLSCQELAEICITSNLSIATSKPPKDAFTLGEGVAVTVQHAQGQKCARCWRITEVQSVKGHLLCQRCQDVVLATATPHP